MIGSRSRAGCAISGLLALFLGLACAESTPEAKEPRTLRGGDPDATPSLEVLPDVPPGGDCDTPRTHQGLLAAREALDATLSEPPLDRSNTSLQRWIDSVVVAWVRERRERIAAVQARFELEADLRDAERIVEHAAVGLLHEDTAKVLSGLPAPSELDTEPEIAEIYREVLDARAEPFISSALLSFRDCANLAYQGDASMQKWAAFCHQRFDRLKRESLERQGLEQSARAN